MTPIYALTLVNGARTCYGQPPIENLSQATDAELDRVYPGSGSSPYAVALERGAEVIREQAYRKWNNETI